MTSYPGATAARRMTIVSVTVIYVPDSMCEEGPDASRPVGVMTGARGGKMQ